MPAAKKPMKAPKNKKPKTVLKRAPARHASRFGVDDFWALIERVRKVSKGSSSAACAAFRKELEALDDASLIEAEGHFSDAMRRAHNWGFWGAAYVIHGGCSDDSFWDARAGLVSMGREVFERTLRDPDSLAEIEDVENRLLFEGFQYQPNKVLEARKLEGHRRGHHAKPVTGKAWQEDEELEELYPRLSARFADS